MLENLGEIFKGWEWVVIVLGFFFLLIRLTLEIDKNDKLKVKIDELETWKKINSHGAPNMEPQDDISSFAVKSQWKKRQRPKSKSGGANIGTYKKIKTKPNDESISDLWSQL